MSRASERSSSLTSALPHHVQGLIAVRCCNGFQRLEQRLNDARDLESQ